MRAGTSLLTAHSERIIPVLVTNAEIAIVEGDWMQVDLRNGVLSKLPSFSERSEIVLKHPFPTPIGLNADFRESPSCDPDMLPRFWNQQFKESVHIVQANSLERFFATDNRDKLRSLESIT